MTKPACKDCRFWDNEDRGEDDVFGFCRRHAPTPFVAYTYQGDERRLLDNTEASWPETCLDEWCGEFNPRDVVGTVDVGVLAPLCDLDLSVRLRNILDAMCVKDWSSFLSVFASDLPGFNPTRSAHIRSVIMQQRNGGKTAASEMIRHLMAIGWPFRE